MFTYLLYCRAGFEKETAAEILAREQHGFCNARENEGYILWNPAPNTSWKSVSKPRELVFARQGVFVAKKLENLPQDDRITPILSAIKDFFELHALKFTYSNLFVECADTNDGKELLPFCKSFSHPLRKALGTQGFVEDKESYGLHIFFLNYAEAYVGFSGRNGFSREQMGIMRLRFPSEAPSRSTLKLEEAFHTFLTSAEQNELLQNGMTAVDLGAAPGGWTYQLAHRNMRVTAVDNANMDPKLLESGLVTHVRDNGLKFLPRSRVDWMVCDIVESPAKIADLAEFWLSKRHCIHTIFNLKLPMKKRYEEVAKLLLRLRENIEGAGFDLHLNCKQLYHDREEVTVFASTGLARVTPR